jgi:hypothetical protein
MGNGWDNEPRDQEFEKTRDQAAACRLLVL